MLAGQGHPLLVAGERALLRFCRTRSRISPLRSTSARSTTGSASTSIIKSLIGAVRVTGAASTVVAEVDPSPLDQRGLHLLSTGQSSSLQLRVSRMLTLREFLHSTPALRDPQDRGVWLLSVSSHRVTSWAPPTAAKSSFRRTHLRM